MTFVLRAGGAANRPLPAFKDLGGGRWEFDCGWCDDVFMDARQLVAHVKRERERGSTHD
jgi:hypothetical protein